MRFKLKKEEYDHLTKEELMAGIMSSSTVSICDAMVAAMTDIMIAVLKDNMAGMFEDLVEDFDPVAFKLHFEDAIRIRAQRDMQEDMGIILVELINKGDLN